MGTCYNCFHEITEQGMCPHCGYEPGMDEWKYPLALAPGSILAGRYVLGHILGQGGFGITYVAQDVQTEKRVAIKEFFPDTLVTRTNGHRVTAITREREENFTYGMSCFLSEAKTLAQFIGEKSIVQVYNYFEENGTAYFVMEYIEGESLQTYLYHRGGKIGWEETKKLLLPMMDALSLVHSKGIIHRDVAPDNIYIARDGTVKLLDFGSARYSLGDRTRSLDVVLKHGYAPKEQYARRGRQGPYTDVYALAATCYYTLTGRVPQESIERLDNDKLILPSILGSDIPKSAEFALKKALAVQPEDRFQTVAEFRNAINKTTTVPQPVLPVLDRRNLWIAAGAAAMVLVVGIAFFLGRSSKTAPQANSTGSNTAVVSAEINRPAPEPVNIPPQQTQTKPVYVPKPEPEPETEPETAPTSNKSYEEMVGRTVRMGEYEQDNERSNGPEPILWRVLTVYGGQALLVSEYALDCMPYAQDESDAYWEGCDLRSWLSNVFYYEAFTYSESSKICPVKTYSNGTYGVDYVSVLGAMDAVVYFDDDEDRVCRATAYAIARGAYVNKSTQGSWWWLMDSRYEDNKVFSVNSDGSIDYDGGSANSAKGVVRPAIWVDVSIFD